MFLPLHIIVCESVYVSVRVRGLFMVYVFDFMYIYITMKKTLDSLN